MKTSQIREALDTLARRREYVDRRLREAEDRGEVLTYDRAERKALSVAIELFAESLEERLEAHERRQLGLPPLWRVIETHEYIARGTRAEIESAFEQTDPHRRPQSAVKSSLRTNLTIEEES